MLRQGFNIPHVIVGRGLGGSGAVNGMLYVRCTESDTQRWNMSEWAWSDVLQTYKDMELYCGGGGGVGEGLDSLQRGGSSTSTSSSYSSSNGAGGSSNAASSDDHDVSSSAPTTYEASGQNRNHNKYSPEDAVDPYKLVTSRPGLVDDISLSFIRSAVVAGVPWTNDFNADRGGVGLYHFNIRAGVRDSVGRRLLGPLLEPYLPLPDDATLIGASETIYGQSRAGSSGGGSSRSDAPRTVNTKRLNSYSNFDLLLGAKVTRLLISGGATVDSASDGSGSSSLARVYGVEYEHHGVTKHAYLKPPGLRESDSTAGSNVILSAGALMSPRILMASGIGPREVLQEAGVPVKVNSPQVCTPQLFLHCVLMHICVNTDWEEPRGPSHGRHRVRSQGRGLGWYAHHL